MANHTTRRPTPQAARALQQRAQPSEPAPANEFTITEALADIKTINKRITKKREAIAQYLARQDIMKDPLLADGASVDFIKREQQAIADLEERIGPIRRAIAHAKAKGQVSIATATTRSLHRRHM